MLRPEIYHGDDGGDCDYDDVDDDGDDAGSDGK